MFALCFLCNVKLFPFVAAPFILVAFLAFNYHVHMQGAAENQLADVATLLKEHLYNTIQYNTSLRPPRQDVHVACYY